MTYTNKLRHGCWKFSNVIVCKVEGLNLLQASERLRHNLEPVVREIKHPQVEKEAEGVRQSGNLVVAQIKELEVRHMQT